MKKILLPTDFSKNAFNAIKYAVQLFKNEKCLFYLLNTYTPVMYDNTYFFYNTDQPSLYEVYKKSSLEGLTRVEKQLQRQFANPKHHYKKISAFNTLGDEIKEQVKENKPDLIVMGTKGATGAQEILFGTNTVHTLKKTRCPLLAVPSGYRYRSPKNILFPSDYEVEFTGFHLDLLTKIAEEHSSKIHVININKGKSLTPEQENSKKILISHIKENAHHFYSFEKSSVPRAIEDFQKSNPMDILVMVKNKHTFFENLFFKQVINDIGFHVKIPFLVIPSEQKFYS